jgi:hypothetical protein
MLNPCQTPTLPPEAVLPAGARWVTLKAAAHLAGTSVRSALRWCEGALVLAFQLPAPKSAGPWRVAVWPSGAPVRLPAPASMRLPGVCA